MKIQLNNEERRNLQTTLANFKSPQHPSNTLVSTNVVEEGLDVRSCNLVIKFDFPDNFRSYVQSKGRTQDVTRDHLRDCPIVPMGPETGPVLEYVASSGDPESAIITGSQAVRLVNNYIQQIKVDRFTKLTCVYEMAESKDKQDNMAGYQTSCCMPHRKDSVVTNYSN